jgi:glycine cleavage system aminomethyltransferase T
MQALVGDRPAPFPHSVAAFDVGSRGLACRLTEEDLLLLAFTKNTAGLREWLTTRRPQLPIVEWDATSAFALFCVLGAGTEMVLRPLTALALGQTAFPAGSCAETSVAGVHALLVRPPGMAFDAVYIAVAWNLAEFMWERLLESGRKQGIAPVGWEAWYRLLS